MKKDKSFAWNETIQQMQAEKEADEYLDSIEFAKKKIIQDHESCKCGIVSGEFELKKHMWQHHKQYCPVWKNGRIAELEGEISIFLNHYESDDTQAWYHYCGRVASKKFKELLKQ